MVKFIARILGPALLGLAFASTAFADGITLSGDFPNGYIWSSFTSTSEITTNGTIIQTSLTTYNEPVSPYTATSTIEGVTIPSQFACLDINNGTYVGTYYGGTFGVAVTTADDEVSWLADQLAGTTPNNPLSYTGAISMAIWQLEFLSSNDSEGGPMPIDPAAQVWITDAANAVADGYQPDSVFFTPNDSTSQRFVEISLTANPGTLELLGAPEPGTLALMGTGFLGLVGLVRRKVRR
jgi:hypothetical protein